MRPSECPRPPKAIKIQSDHRLDFKFRQPTASHPTVAAQKADAATVPASRSFNKSVDDLGVRVYIQQHG
jgi:hypothetical protein